MPPSELNPFAPPLSEIEMATSAVDAAGEPRLATRRQRFVGALVDFLILFPGAWLLNQDGGPGSSVVHPSVSYLRLGVAYMVVCWLFQFWLIAKTGQTIGKRMQRTRIVMNDGAPVTFVAGVMLRYLVLLVLSYGLPPLARLLGVPTSLADNLVMALSLVDDLVIFGVSRRCLHDHLAGTKVVMMP